MNWIQLSFIDRCFDIHSTNQCLRSWMDSMFPDMDNKET